MENRKKERKRKKKQRERGKKSHRKVILPKCLQIKCLSVFISKYSR